MSTFPHLFSPLKVGGMEVRNRILSTGHDTVMAHDGHVTDRLIAYQEARARGGVGLIVVQVSGVHETARYTSHILMATSDDAIPGYRARWREAVHRHGAKICGQLFHPGREIMETQDGTAPVAYAPSAVPNSRFHVMPVPLSLQHDARNRLRLWRCGGAADGGRLRRLRDRRQPRLSAGAVPQPQRQPARGRLWRQRREPRCASCARWPPTSGPRPRPISSSACASPARSTTARRSTRREVLTFCKMLDGDGVIDYFNVIAGTSASLKGAVHIVPPMYFPERLFGALRRRAQVGGQQAGLRRRPHQPAADRRAGAGLRPGRHVRHDAGDDLRSRNAGARRRQGRLDDIRACIACNQACIGHFHKGYPISCIQHPGDGPRADAGREAAGGAAQARHRRRRRSGRHEGGGGAGRARARGRPARGRRPSSAARRGWRSCCRVGPSSAASSPISSARWNWPASRCIASRR